MTSEHEALLRTVYQSFEDRPLPPDSPFYEPIHKSAEDREEPIDRLTQGIKYSPAQSLQFFSGFRGSGKTTELLRLKKRLEDDGYFVVYADALDYLNPAAKIDISDLLIVLAGAFGDRLGEVLGKDMIGESYWTRFTHFLTNTKVEIPEISNILNFPLPNIGVNPGASFKITLKESPTFRQQIQEKVGAHIGTLKSDADQFFEDCVKRIRKRERDKPIVFIFDSLEKIRGSVLHEMEVIRSVESLFANHADKLKFPEIHVVYTVPPWLKFVLPGFRRIEIIPSVRQWENDSGRTAYQPGMNSLRSLVKRRVGEDGLKKLFGDPKRADRLIEVCGGHLRDLGDLFQELVIRAGRKLPVSDTTLSHTIGFVRGRYVPIAVNDALWLAKIAETRRADHPDLTESGRLARFLDTHLVLYLMNGEEWYDIHPLIRRQVAEIAADYQPESESGEK